jgi:ADP-ribosylglycohydrolase
MKKLLQFIPLACVLCLFTGCAAVTRTVTDVGWGAGGAALGSKLSHNDPLATVGSAAGGVLLGEGLHYANSKQNDKSYQTGYDKGRSDAVKQQYWLYVAMQHQRNETESVRLYPVRLPEQRIDGVTFKPSTKYLRIEE